MGVVEIRMLRRLCDVARKNRTRNARIGKTERDRDLDARDMTGDGRGWNEDAAMDVWRDSEEQNQKYKNRKQWRWRKCRCKRPD